MADIKGLLTDKVGPLPGWAWLLVGGGTLYFVLPKLTGGSSTATARPSPTDTSAANIAGYQSGFAQGAQYYPPAAPGAPATVSPSAAAQPATAAGFPAFEAWLQQAYNGTRADLLKAINEGRWSDLQGQYTKEAIAYAKQHQTASAAGTGGVGRRGSRSADPMAYFHPAMKRKPRYTHWTKVGAPADVAQQIGVHPARLMMLNDPGPASLRPGTRVA